jgi:hypothetical protein
LVVRTPPKQAGIVNKPESGFCAELVLTRTREHISNVDFLRWSGMRSRPLSGCPPWCQSKRQASLRGAWAWYCAGGYPTMGSLGALRVFRDFMFRLCCFTWWQVEGPPLGSSLVLPRCFTQRSVLAPPTWCGRRARAVTWSLFQLPLLVHPKSASWTSSALFHHFVRPSRAFWPVPFVFRAGLLSP